ncbi:response regulator [Butyrivibrio sp. FC2001]|uniref:response regulator n=1 Tax=Butyrivibrio sp. FC2001 TaxID=1280671 RepID=UPI0004044A60|nr:response regulator [Butyrivibrio sp. FC2001]
MNKKKQAAGVIIIVLIALIIVNSLNLVLVFKTTADETINAGKYQLESIGAELENGINNAKNLTAEYSYKAQAISSDHEALESFIYEAKEEVKIKTDGVGFNVYAAGTDWEIIPELDDENYSATDRSWYTGAVRNSGNVYITAPYIDAVSGNICYSVSKAIDNNGSVLAIDYTLAKIQEEIQKISITDNNLSVIVTEEGVIAGCSDDRYVGTFLADSYPDYVGIFNVAKGSTETVSIKIRKGLVNDNLFATGTNSGWYLIVCINDWELYRNSYVWLVGAMILNVILFSVVFALYFISKSNEIKAQEALEEKEDFLKTVSGNLKTPLNQILNNADSTVFDEDMNYEARFKTIQEASIQLSEYIHQIISYSNYVKGENQKHARLNVKKYARVSSRFRNIIIILMCITMLISVFSISWMTSRWCRARMQEAVGEYESQVSEWTVSQKSILDMFCNDIATNPGILNDYNETITYLDRVTACYDQISATYIANKEFSPTVFMNNGWKPGTDFRIEDRQWYMDTINSESGFNISSPYIDAQTGLYCITFSQEVFDKNTGDFLGVFGIDFYIDKLVEILGNSYSNESYAFLTDARGVIINHPYGTYQMTKDRSTNIASLPYKDAYKNQETVDIIKDYDSVYKVIIAEKSSVSDFTVFVVFNFLAIYGRTILYGSIAFFVSLICVIIIYRLLGGLITWQDEMNTKLQESADAAIAAGKAKSDFLAMMSHEIRTPINAIIGMNEMIIRECSSDDIKGYAANIQSASKTLLTLINSILDFSKIEEGKLEIVNVNYETKSLLADVINMINARIKKTNLEFKLDIDPKLPMGMYGDDFRIKQVILNLLTNAVKYTEKGSVTLSIVGTEIGKEHIMLDVKISDTGIGIRDADIDKLNMSFQRFDQRRNKNIEGTGLGIAIVTSLLEMMGSNLKVKSVYGEGSEFSFELKQKVIDWRHIGEFDINNIIMEAEQDEDKYLVAEYAEILVVDDNDMNLAVMKSLLKRNRIKPDFASSGQECIDKVSTKHYDIIMLDHMMPEMDGIETLIKIREKKLLRKDTTVIALTANAVLGAKEEYIAAGFDDYLSKPVDPKSLEKLLSKYLPSFKVSYVQNEEEEAKEEKKAVKGPDLDEDIIEFVPTGEVGAIVAEDNDAIDDLRDLEYLKVDEAVGLCGTEDAYITILQMFIRSADAKEKRIRELYEAKDIKNYIIEMHALKSSARLIGADEFSELARELEFAGKDNKIETIDEKTGAIFEWYDRIKDDISYILE